MAERLLSSDLCKTLLPESTYASLQMRDGDMKEASRKVRIGTYKAQLAMCEQVCSTLSKELENADLEEDQMLAIGHRLDQATKARIALQFALDRLEQEEREQTGHLQS